MTDLPADHLPGANNPPANDFEQRLEAKNDTLLDMEADLSLDSGKLPREVASDDDVAAITAWVTKVRKLAREVEDRRVVEKEPYLDRGRRIDTWFGKFKDRLLTRAKEVEQRSTAYLQAKQARAQAEARARQEAAAAERRRQEAVAEEARRVEREAAARARRAEEEVAAAARRSAEETAAAEAKLRAANQASAAAAAKTEAADKEVRTAAQAEERAERRAENPTELGKAPGGGGNARVEMAPHFRVVSVSKFLQSLGPFHQWVDMKELERPMQRWANIAKEKPEIRAEIPGLEYFETAVTKTTATRDRNG